MEVRDPVHGTISIHPSEIAILESPFFQRLRNIKQLGLSEYIFPGATHTRFLHSIGVMHLSTLIFDRVVPNHFSLIEMQRLRQTVRLAALLHDIGHAPLSHSTESVMPMMADLKLPLLYGGNQQRQANHEDYTIKALIDGPITEFFGATEKFFGVTTDAVAQIIAGKCITPDYFTVANINFFPLFSQIVSSELDADRMDYLLRDSYFCGVSYGKIDVDWLIDNMGICIENNFAYLSLAQKAVASFDDFLLSRLNMFLMVYFHYRSVCLEQMLLKYFLSEEKEYSIPPSLDQYINHDDHFLTKVLRDSKNKWAKNIVSNKIPPKIFETYGHEHEDQNKMEQLKTILTDAEVDFIYSESVGRLSKYHNIESAQQSLVGSNFFPIKIKKSYPRAGDAGHLNLNDSTQVYDRFKDTHSITRLHAFMDSHSSLSKKIQQIIVN